MLLVIEDRATFHLLPLTETPQRSTEQALRRMGWLDLSAAPAAATIRGAPPSAEAAATGAMAPALAAH